jgi:quercetin dioxygenase-like cupin family protein
MHETNDWRGKAIPLAATVDYAEGAVVSKTLLDKPAGTLTLFAFDAGQGLSEHTAPYDATIHILDGEATVTIGNVAHTVGAGELIIMPAGVPHALKADKPFKMLLIMIRERTANKEH